MTNVGASSWGAPSPQGPGWWQASDGLWYPPQDQPPQPPAQPQQPADQQPAQPQPTYQQPAYQQPAYQQPAYQQPVVQVPVHGYHVEQGLAPGEVRVAYHAATEQVARLRPLYVGFLAIPAFFTLLGVAIVAAFSSYAALFGTIFMGRVHPSSHANIVKAYRFQWRLTTYLLCWRGARPAPGPAGAVDAGDDPAQLSIAYGGEGLSRLGPIIKPFLAIPKIIVLFFKMLGGYVTAVVGLFGVLFKGEFPEAGKQKLTALYQEATELNSYLVLSDRKPS